MTPAGIQQYVPGAMQPIVKEELTPGAQEIVTLATLHAHVTIIHLLHQGAAAHLHAAAAP